MFKVLHPSLHVQELCPSKGQKDPWSKDILGMILIVAVVRLLSHVRLFATPWSAAHQAPLSFTISRNLLKLMSIETGCHSAIPSCVVPLSSCLQSFPVSGAFSVSWLFPLGGQSIGALASASVIPMNIHN